MSDNQSKIKVAVLGCGMMGQEHISYMKGFPEIQLQWLCDPCPSSLLKSLNIIGNSYSPKTFDCEKQMFQDHEVQSQLDLLVIATPNFLHTPQLLRWAQRSITILVEKPVAISERQVSALRAAGPNFRADIWVAMEYRFIPAIQKLLQLLPKIGPLKKIAIRENRYPFLKKIGEWNKDIDKSGDTLVEKCCHFFDLFRLISGCEMKRCTSMVHRGLNFEDYGYHSRTDNPVPIIDGAYVLLDLADMKTSEFLDADEEKDPELSGRIRKASSNGSTALGCLELCMFAEGSRHQEEIVVTGLLGRLEAYLPENKVFLYHRPSRADWPDRSVPPPKSAIRETIVDCSDLANVYSFANEIPQHKGYHYCSTAIEWKYLIDQIKTKRDGGIFNAQVTLEDGIKAVEMGIAAMNQIVNIHDEASQDWAYSPIVESYPRKIYPIVACTSMSSENLLNLALMNNLAVAMSQEGIMKAPSPVEEEA